MADLHHILAELEGLENIAKEWPEPIQQTVQKRIAAVEALNKTAFQTLIRRLQAVPEAAEALRELAADETVYVVLRRHGLLKPSLAEEIEAALDTVRPALADHGGDVELVAVNPPVAELRFLGACDGCPASMLTFVAGVKKAVLTHVPAITEIKQVKGLGTGYGGPDKIVSPFEGGWLALAALDDFAPDQTRFIAIADRPLVVSRQADGIVCYDAICAHMGQRLDGGNIAEGILTCPHHGFQYVLATGTCLTAPDLALRRFATRITGDTIEVQLAP